MNADTLPVPSGDQRPRDGAAIDPMEFERFREQVTVYAVDDAEGRGLWWQQREVRRITTNDFNEHLYQEWTADDYEKRLARFMVQGPGVVAVVGERGSGKTSALVYAEHLISLGQARVKTFRLDIKRRPPGTRIDDIDAAELDRVLTSYILDHLWAEFFGDPAKECGLIAWALAGPPDESEPFDKALYVGLAADSSTALVETGCPRSQTRAQRRRYLRDRLLQDRAGFVKYKTAIICRLEPAHLIQALCSIEDIDKFVLILDNFDRLSDAQQVHMMTVATDQQRTIGDACTFVVSLRRENLRGHKPPPNAGGNTVTVVLPNRVQYPGMLLPQASEDHVEGVLRKRTAFAKDVLRQVLSLTKIEDLAGFDDQVHEFVLSQLRESQVHALSNHSTRNAMAIYVAFKRYLHELVDTKKQRPDQVRIDMTLASAEDRVAFEKHLHTLFYLFLGQRGRSVGIPTYNILKWKASGQGQEYHDWVDAHHVLLTCVLNMERQLNASVFSPLWRHVVSELQELGFDYRTIRGAMDDFVASPGEEPGPLEFVNSEVTPHGIDADSDEMVRLTPLGSHLAGVVMHKVGYIWASAEQQYPHFFGGRRNYFFLSEAQRIRHLFQFIRITFLPCLNALCFLRDRWRDTYGEKWMSVYRDRFGVDSKLQIERVLEQAGRFYTPAVNWHGAEPFECLDQCFRALLTQVEAGDPPTVLNFQKTMRCHKLLKKLERMENGRKET